MSKMARDAIFVENNNYGMPIDRKRYCSIQNMPISKHMCTLLDFQHLIIVIVISTICMRQNRSIICLDRIEAARSSGGPKILVYIYIHMYTHTLVGWTVGRWVGTASLGTLLKSLCTWDSAAGRVHSNSSLAAAHAWWEFH
jgi:hypothetical protein